MRWRLCSTSIIAWSGKKQMNMLWVRAIWKEERREEEGVIPSTWVKDGIVFWPFVKNAQRAMQTGQLPTSSWKKFPLVREKLRSASKEECESVEYTTAVESDEDEETIAEGKRVQKRKSFPDFVLQAGQSREIDTSTVDWQQSSGHSDEDENQLPPPPKKVKPSRPVMRESSPTGWSRRVEKPGRLPDSSPAYSSPRSPSPPVPPRIRNERSPSPPRTPATTSPRRSPRLQVPRSLNENHGRQNNPGPRHRSAEARMREDLGADLPYPLPTARYQKKVMHLLVKLNQAVEDLQAFNRRQESAALGIMELPPQATTIEEVRSLEDSLRSEEYRQKMMQSLTRIGGSNTKDNGKRIMEKLMTNQVMTNYNMCGNKGKQAFQKMQLCNIIKASIMKTMGCTEADASASISLCLKYAPDRRGGGGRK